MSHLRTWLGIALVLSPLVILLCFAVAKIRAGIGLRQTMLLSLVLFFVMCFAVIAECVIERRFLIYESVMLAGAAGMVAVRVNRYLKARGKG